RPFLPRTRLRADGRAATGALRAGARGRSHAQEAGPALSARSIRAKTSRARARPAGSSESRLRGAAPRALLQPSRAAREALAMVVLAGHLAAVAIEDDERWGAPPALTARLAKRVRREVRGIDRRGGHRRSSTTGRASASRCPRPLHPWSRRLLRVLGILARVTQTARRPRLSRRGLGWVTALARPVPRRSPAEHARRRAERLADRRLFSPPERARWLARRNAQLARLARVADERHAS